MSSKCVSNNGKEWTCNKCTRTDPHIHKTDVIQPTNTCSEKCKIHYAKLYEFYNQPVLTIISQLPIKYGDLLCRKNINTCSELYIINSELQPERLKINANLQYIIPISHVNDLGLFYWNEIQKRSGIAIIYNKKNSQDLLKKLLKKEISLESLKNTFGQEIIDKLIITISKKSKTKHWHCYQGMTKEELIKEGQKRGKKLNMSMLKQDMISRLKTRGSLE
jgi:hypothetical protein